MIRILVIEDEARLARLISRVLKEEGYAPETASDGKTGLSLALVEEFDLLVVDWMLPDLDGVEVIRRLRAAEMSVPVLMLKEQARVGRHTLRGELGGELDLLEVEGIPGAVDVRVQGDAVGLEVEAQDVRLGLSLLAEGEVGVMGRGSGLSSGCPRRRRRRIRGPRPRPCRRR